MAKIMRMLEHNGIFFKEDDYILVTFDNGRQVRGRISLPTESSLVVGGYSLSDAINRIKNIQKLN